MKRRKFIKNASLTGAGLAMGSTLSSCKDASTESNPKEMNKIVIDKTKFPIAICTWQFT